MSSQYSYFPTIPLRPTHEALRVPNQNALIPTATRGPAFSTKQAPIHARHKLRMRIHTAQLATHSTVRSIGPDTTRHVVRGREQDIGEVGRPRDLADRVFVAVEHGKGGGGVPNVECADNAVDACGGDGVGAVLVPVVGEGFRGLEGRGWAVGADGLNV